jgi:hypothetical protein
MGGTQPVRIMTYPPIVAIKRVDRKVDKAITSGPRQNTMMLAIAQHAAKL